MNPAIHEHQRFHYRTLDELRADLERLGLDLPLSEDLSILGRPLSLDGLTVPNRLAVHPMEGFDAGADGAPTELTFRRYRRYAAGGAGLIWFEATAILDEARSNPGQLYLHQANVAVYQRLVEQTRRAAREAGWPVPALVLQLTHSGRYSKPTGLPAPLIVHHSPILDPLHNLPADYTLVSDDYLDRLQDTFAAAARLAAAAGFDGVDVKSCHRYLLSELLASFTREGKYGGSFANRTRMLRETVARIAAEVPEVFVTTRLNAYDGMAYPHGWGVNSDDPALPDLAEPLALVGKLQTLGLPVLNVTIGNPYFNPYLNRPFDFPIKGVEAPDEHPLAGVARFIGITGAIQRAHPGLPVVGSGYSWLRQFMPNAAAAAVAAGGAALIGQGRGSFAYPDSVRDILREGRMDPAKCCVTCSACTQIMRDGGKTGCVVRDGEIYGPQYRMGRRFALDRLRDEARRCRECQEPTCVRACPAGVEVPAFLRAFADGEIARAYGIIRRSNVLPEMCGAICPSAEQCEGGCLERTFCERAVPIRDIQLVTSRLARLQGLTGLRLPAGETGRRAAVVGGGPAGIACAAGLLEAGHRVAIYEKELRLGGTPDVMIPAERYADAQAEIDALLAPALAAGRLELLLGRALGAEVSLDELRRRYDAVFLAAGLTGIRTAERIAGVIDAPGFLVKAKRGEMKELRGRAAVLGGGNTAVDAAVTAKRLGASDVFLVYRRSYLQMSAWAEDRRVLLEAGVEPLFLTQPLGYESAGGRLTGLRIARTSLGAPDVSGRRSPEAVPGSEAVLPVEMVVEAMGQEIDARLGAALGGLVVDGCVRTKPGSSATDEAGVFAGGDLVNGGRTAVQAVAEGMRAAAEIDAYLGRI